MSRISISETQFAFAFFHKYLLLNKDNDVKFCFPSLRQEGDPDYGYAGADLVVDGNLFFQFKMPDFLRIRNATEIINKQISKDFIPFYRFNIKNSDPSNQFNLLKDAARKPANIVRYISPMFHSDRHQTDDVAFYNYFRMTPADSMNEICSIDFSQFISPTEENLSSDNSHKICYNRESVTANYAYLFSKPKEIKAEKGLIEYKKQKLVFNNDPTKFEKVDTVLNYIQELFFKHEKDRQHKHITIEQLQIEIIIKHNIFWLPILRSVSERRIPLIDETLPKEE